MLSECETSQYRCNSKIMRFFGLCPQNDKSYSRVAFTLAEVLITLGVIGVVAAMTMPTLIKNYQKQVYVTQFKKTVNFLTNNFRYVMSQKACDTLVCTGLALDGFQSSIYIDTDKYLKFFKLNLMPENSLTYKSFEGIGTGLNKILLSKNGSCFKFLEGVTGGHVITTLVDTNCDNAPNKIGRDRFLILFENNGFPNFVATESELSLCEQLLNYDTSGITDEEELREINLTLLIFAGSACAAKIVDDGWKMDY